MGSTFNPQILVDKLAKLNSSQASIETLSHWCIFHMNKAKYVVETWDRQFHCTPREQRLAFLYLANDILQNSRRKGSEFVGEFWKVLPGALQDVIDNGDESGRNAALRLIGIWEERKVFGSRAQNLKEEFLGKHLEKSNRDGKHLSLKPPVGSPLDKIVSGYQVVYDAQMDEDFILNKYRNAMAYFDKLEKEIDPNIHSGGAAFVEELRGQHAILRDSIKHLTAIESSRANLVSQLREAILEQESKLEQIRDQLKAARSQSERADNICQQFLPSNKVQVVAEQISKGAITSTAPQNFGGVDREQSAPVMYARQVSLSEKGSYIEEDSRKSAAAAVAEKLTASTSSAQMLSYVLSSLASEGMIGNGRKEPTAEHSSEKRAKLENDLPYTPTQNPLQPPHPSFQHPESFQSHITLTTSQLNMYEPPPPPSSPPPLPPLPPNPQYSAPSIPQYVPSAEQISGVPFSYASPQQLPSLPGYPPVGNPMTSMMPFTMPPTYQTYQGSEGNLYSQQSSMPMAPISRQ